jgi:hypothetical protein
VTLEGLVDALWSAADAPTTRIDALPDRQSDSLRIGTTTAWKHLTLRSESWTSAPRAGVLGGRAVKRKNRRLIAVSLAIATSADIAIAGVALLLSAEKTPTSRPAPSTTEPEPFAELRMRPLRLPARRRGNCSLSPQLSRATELPGIPAEAGLGGVSGAQIHPSRCSGVFVDQSAKPVAAVALI